MLKYIDRIFYILYIVHMETVLEPSISLDFFETAASATDVSAAAKAMFNTIEYRESYGVPTEKPTKESMDIARNVLTGKMYPSDISDSPTAMHLHMLVDTYDRQVVQDYAQMRQYVVNRLIEESQPGSRTAIRALELLGKVSGVDLFVERSEVTVTTRNTDELRQLVKEKLMKLRGLPDTPVRDVTPKPSEAIPDPNKRVAQAQYDVANAKIEDMLDDI